MDQYFIYIMTNASGTLYIGVTNDLLRRISEHKNGQIPGFTQKYHITRLVYFEASTSHIDAINREKQLKGWRREKKVQLIESINPKWLDLAADWYSEDSCEKN